MIEATDKTNFCTSDSLACMFCLVRVMHNMYANLHIGVC